MPISRPEGSPIRPTGRPTGPSGKAPGGFKREKPETHGESVREVFRSVYGRAVYASGGKAERGLRYLGEKCGKDEALFLMQGAYNDPKKGAPFQDERGNNFTIFYDPVRKGWNVKERGFGPGERRWA